MFSTDEDSNPFAAELGKRHHEVVHVRDVAFVRFVEFELWSTGSEQHGEDEGDLGLGETVECYSCGDFVTGQGRLSYGFIFWMDFVQSGGNERKIWRCRTHVMPKQLRDPRLNGTKFRFMFGLISPNQRSGANSKGSS